MCRYDANVDLADRWGGTALTAALRHGHLAIAKMLMSCEAKLGSHTDPDLVQVSLTRPAATLTATEPYNVYHSFEALLSVSCP